MTRHQRIIPKISFAATRSGILLVLLATSCFSASLECTDSENSACELDISYQELADAFNLNCQAKEDGLVCKFETPRGKSPVVASTTNIVVPETSKIKECSTRDHLSVCLQADINTKLEIKQSTGISASNGENSNAENSNLAAGNEAGEFSIKIGNHHYREPFDRYAAPVARALQVRQHLWKQPTQGTQYEYELAYALVDVGIAHFTASLDESGNPGKYGNDLLESFDIKLAVNAFQEAEMLYERVYEKYSSDKHSISMRLLCLSMGNLYLQWGEIYQSSDYYEEYIDTDLAHEEGDGVPTENDFALRYFEKAEMYYRHGLDASVANKADMPTILDAQTKLAHACHRVARCQINLLGGLAMDTIVQYAPGESTVEVLPQVLKLLTITGKAEEMFEEAARLYRLAIEREKDFNSRIQLKNYLTTTLHDYGTAASYANNADKAVKLKQEGLSVCEEILPHLAGSSQDFMLQYLADGLLSVSTLLMQLGKYDETNKVYDSAMDWYDKNNLEPSAPRYYLGYDVSDEALEAQEQALVDFHEMKAEYSIPDGFDEPMYTTNGAYEGYLHAMLGSLHLSRDEVLMAIDHFKQAVRLYEDDEAGQDLDLSIADTKVRYALSHLHLPIMYSIVQPFSSLALNCSPAPRRV